MTLDLDATAAFLTALPEPWAQNPVTARALAPLLLDRALERGWDLDPTLAGQLARTGGGTIYNHLSVLRTRIDTLPDRSPQPDQPATRICCDCGQARHTITDDGRCLPCLGGPVFEPETAEERDAIPAGPDPRRCPGCGHLMRPRIAAEWSEHQECAACRAAVATIPTARQEQP